MARSEKGEGEVYCSNCGEIISEAAEICPECGVRQHPPADSVKNPGLAAVGSFFFTGLGQIYNGQIWKGIGLIILQSVNILLMFVLIGFLTYFIVWVYGIYDAYSVAKRINAGEISI